MPLFAVPKGKTQKNKKNKKELKPKAVRQAHRYTQEESGIIVLIRRRRLQMLVHSCIYYRLADSLISDKQFDTWGRELVKLQKDNPELSKEVEWYEAFKDWDATTGYHLPLHESWVVETAQHLLNICRERKE